MKLVASVLFSVFLIVLMQHFIEFCAAAKSNKVSATINPVRIVGGVTTTISKVPYLINLRLNGRFVCGGSLVSRRFVVTAAHCVHGVNPHDMVVVGGSSVLTSGTVREISKILKPKQFTIRTMHMDVAVIKLRSRMHGPNIKPIKLCSHGLQTGAAVKVSGWGLTDETNTSPSTRLRTTVVRLVSYESCQRSYEGILLTHTMICASVPGIRDSCSGDSGGPMIHKKQLCGIVSWGVGCGRADSPGVYTSVNQVKKFIMRSMKN